MKTIAKMILPVAAFMLASASAISTDVKTSNKSKDVLISAWVQNPDANNCVSQINLDCTTASGHPVCMSSELTPRQVFNKNIGNACSVPLYKTH
jgi:hypothetical protein